MNRIDTNGKAESFAYHLCFFLRTSEFAPLYKVTAFVLAYTSVSIHTDLENLFPFI